MKNHSLVVAMITFSCMASAAGAKYSGGTGEPNNPYQIATAEDLNDIGNYEEDWDKHFILVNDVNLAEYTGTQFKIIGEFKGFFDGNDHKIWNFTWNSSGGNNIGLFSGVGGGSQIKNLGMENVNIDTKLGANVGGLIGFNESGTVTNCYSIGSVRAEGLFVGLLVGSNNGSIVNCYAIGTVAGWDETGGLVGYHSGTISDCYSIVSVLGSEDCFGGLVGRCYQGTITRSYSEGSVTGCSACNGFGGLVGCNYYGTITNCYSSANVSSSKCVGGLVAENSYGEITNCYSTGIVSGGDYTG